MVADLRMAGKPTEFTFDEPHSHVTLGEAKATFEWTIDCLAELKLLDSLQSAQRQDDNPQWGEVNGPSFDAFVARYSQPDAPLTIPELKVNENKIYVDRPGEYDRSNRRLGDTNTWIDIINSDACLEAPIPPVAWATIFDSLEWTEEGPHGRN